MSYDPNELVEQLLKSFEIQAQICDRANNDRNQFLIGKREAMIEASQITKNWHSFFTNRSEME